MSSAKDRGELTITLRMKGRPVVLVGEGDIAEDQRRLLKRAGAFLVAEGSKAAFAVVVDDAAAVSRLKVRGCLVYAVGQPELSDFTFTSPAPPAKAAPSVKAARKAESVSAKLQSPDPAFEPIAAATIPETPEVREPRRAAKLPKPPRPERPPVEIKLPQVSVEPVIRAARAAGKLLHGLGARSTALVSPLSRMSTPFARTVALNIQDRIDRARERPISLDLALVKGGLLDHEPETGKPESGKPGTANPEQPAAQATASPHIAPSGIDPVDPATS